MPRASVGEALSLKRLAKITFAAKIGRNATTLAATSRSPTGMASSHDEGTSHASARPPSRIPYMRLTGGVGQRLVTSTASSTASSTPTNTIAFTTQVVPNSRAKPVTLLVSSRRKAAPSRKRSR